MARPGALQRGTVVFFHWILGALTVTGVGAADSEFISRNWRREEGLPDNSVQSILQTRDGYLWIGTARGLARYDGLRFTVFDRANTPELKSDNVKCLAEDREGNLWIGTTSGLLEMTGSTRVWYGPENGLLDNFVTAIHPSRLGGIWVGSHFGLLRVADGKAIRYGNASDWKTNGVLSLHEDAAGVLWVGTKNGLCQLDPGDSEFRYAVPPKPLPGLEVHAIQGANNGGLWVLVANSHPSSWLYQFRYGNWEMACREMDFHFTGTFLCLTRAGDLWLSPHMAALHRFQSGRLTSHLMTPDAAVVSPQSAYEDREGNLWIGTENAGLYRWQPRRILVLSKRDGLSHDNVWTIRETRDGSIWIGTDDGLSQFRDGAFTRFTMAEGLPRNIVRALAEDHSGRLWVGTGLGLACLDAGLFIRHRFQGQWFSSKIRALLVDHQNQLWVGSANGLHRLPLAGAGSASLHDEGQRVIDPNITVTFQTTEGLPHNDVSALLEDRSGALWIGTSGGLCRMHDGRIASVSNAGSLANGNVGVFCEDVQGVLWIGAERSLHRYRDGQFTAFGPREGLFDDAINSILEDDHGHLWFGGDHGIYRIAKAELNAVADESARRVTPVVYTDADGLPSNETNGQKSQPAGWKANDGRLWFPTTKGIVMFDPEHLPDNTNQPPVVIEQVRANGQVVFAEGASLEPRVSDSGSVVFVNSKPRTRDAGLILPPGTADVLEFQYTANSFVAPDRIHFKYRLDGQDKEWVDAGPRRAAYYTNLRPGDYRFRVIAANSHGVWSETGAALSLHVAPHYYQTLMFKVGCALAVSSLTLGAYRWRVAELRKFQRLEQQAALTAERVRIAKDLHDGLGANLTHLTLLADLAEQEPAETHSLRMRNLAASSREAARSLKDFLWTTQPADETIDGLLARVCQHAEEFLGAARIRCRFDLPEEWPAHSLPAAVLQNLFLVAREALNNVAKHSGAKEVIISAAADRGTFTLQIQDDGHGFDLEDPKLETPNSKPARFGHGLANMQSRVNEVGGRFTLESQPGRGTRIRIEMPLKATKQ